MKCAMIFPGYGNQFVGMGKDLYDESRVIQEYFEEASHCLNYNFVQICFASSEQELARIEYAYPALFLLGSACFSLLQDRSIIADTFTGFDVGMYTALHAGEALSFPDGLYILSKLASFYQSCLTHNNFASFRVTGLEEHVVHDLCQTMSTEEEWAAIGAYEDSTTFIVVGHYNVTEPLREHMHKIRNVKAKRYPLEAGAFAPLCNDVLAQYKLYLGKIDYHEVTHSCIAPDGTYVYSRDAVRELLLHTLFQPAYYDRVVASLAKYDAVIVPMPEKKMAEYLQRQLPNTAIYRLTNMADLDTIEKNVLHRYEE